MSNQNALHTAGATVDAVKVYDERLAELYARGTADPLEVKGLNSRIGIGLKLAEVYALMAVAEALEGGTIAELERRLAQRRRELGES